MPSSAAERLPSALASGLRSSHLSGIDGIRAIAAFLVVFYHYGFRWCPRGPGVLVFFVLSGFLGKISLKLFYIRRSLRIFPAFYAFWFLWIGTLVLLGKKFNVPQAITSFFYVNNYYQAIYGDPNTGLSHTWSLGIEEQFYLVWPLVFLLLKRDRTTDLVPFVGHRGRVALPWVPRARASTAPGLHLRGLRDARRPSPDRLPACAGAANRNAGLAVATCLLERPAGLGHGRPIGSVHYHREPGDMAVPGHDWVRRRSRAGGGAHPAMHRGPREGVPHSSPPMAFSRRVRRCCSSATSSPNIRLYSPACSTGLVRCSRDLRSAIRRMAVTSCRR